MIGSGLGLNGSNYAILVGGGDGLSGFLIDDYGGAAAAYSLRKLSASYSGPAIRVREEGGNQESDIGFDSNGKLDLATLATFCNGTVGRVVTWYDQSSNANHATQSIASFQPQIYNGTAVITENGMPALEFVTGSTNMQSVANIGISGTGDRTNFIVAECDNISGNTESTVMSYGGSSVGEAWQTTFEPWIRVGGGYQSFSGTTANTQHLLTTALWSGTNVTDSSMFIDGSAATAGAAASRTLNTTDSTLKLGAGSSGSPLFSGTIQEVMVWDSDQSSSRSGIETNINSEYLIYQPTEAPTTGLLADYSGAAAAYSVRRLSDKAVIAMRIRRDSDNAETNIGFDSNGDLDTQAIIDFCGVANGRVVQWMDQSTNGNHAVMTTQSLQPQIYDGSSINEINGKPAIDNESINTSGVGFTLSGVSVTQPYTIQSVFAVKANKIGGTYAWSSLPLPYLRNDIGNDSFSVIGGGNFVFSTANGNSVTNPAQDCQVSTFISADATNLEIFASSNNAQESGTTTGTVTTYTPTYLTNRRVGDISNYHFQEYILWDSDYTGDQSSIENNINSYFSIHQ